MAAQALLRAARSIAQIHHSQGKGLLRRPSSEGMRTQPGGGWTMAALTTHTFHIKIPELKFRCDDQRPVVVPGLRADRALQAVWPVRPLGVGPVPAHRRHLRRPLLRALDLD